MEDNTNLNGQDPQVAEGTTTTPEVDYKALYEKLQRDNANLDKYNKDLKAKYQSKLSDEEKLRASQEERENYYKQIERENKSIKLKSELSKINGDAKWVDSVSDLFLNDDIYGGIQKFSEYFSGEKTNYEKKIQEQSLLKNPTPPPAEGQGVGSVSQKDFDKMGYKDRVALKEKDPDLYEKLTKNIR